MKNIFGIFLVVLGQVIFLNGFHLLGVSPNLILILILVFVVLDKTWLAQITAFTGGLAWGLFSGSLSFFPFLGFEVVFLASLWICRFWRRVRLWHLFGLTIIFTFLYNILWASLLDWQHLSLCLIGTLKEGLLNSLFMAGIYYVFFKAILFRNRRFFPKIS